MILPLAALANAPLLDREIKAFAAEIRILLAPADYPEEKHTHIVFNLTGGMELRFSDTRRFGRFRLLGKDETDTYSGIEKLGFLQCHNPMLYGKN